MARYTRDELIQKIIETANAWNINPDVAVAQLAHESVNFADKYVYGPGTSPAGAMGVAQFMPGTWAIYGSGDPFNPDDALPAWAKYMRHLLDLFGGDYRLALAGYHSGEGAARGALRNPAGNPRTNNYVNTILSRAGVTNNAVIADENWEPDNSLLLIGALGLVLLVVLWK